MNKHLFFVSIFVLCIAIGIVIYYSFSNKPVSNQDSSILNQINFGGLINEPSPLSIEYMRKQEYPGSAVVIEQTLPSGSNYNRYIASYKSDGLKINALLTVPQGENPPAGGWPVIIFNHGYIQPEAYRKTEKYIAYTDAFSRNGYIVFKSDYRGQGNSEGEASGAYGSNSYTIDVLNALTSVKQLPEAD